jgi:hypothetical protein
MRKSLYAGDLDIRGAHAKASGVGISGKPLIKARNRPEKAVLPKG